MEMIKYLIMDVDGTLTDGKIYVSNDGEIMKAFSVKDGAGIHDILLPIGIIPVIITGRVSKIVENRCLEIGIKNIYQGVSNKKQKLFEITKDLSSVAYIGDDINDLEIMKVIKIAGGKVGCPSDAILSVKNLADFISSKSGGDGAVREFIEWLLSDH